MDVPLDLRVELLKNSTFEKGVLRSKAVGEPPKILSYTVFEAIKIAIAASREERGLSTVFDLNVPATVNAIKVAAAVSVDDLNMK
jgi:xanthine dehydrogenase/oxidase